MTWRLIAYLGMLSLTMAAISIDRAFFCSWDRREKKEKQWTFAIRSAVRGLLVVGDLHMGNVIVLCRVEARPH